MAKRKKTAKIDARDEPSGSLGGLGAAFAAAGFQPAQEAPTPPTPAAPVASSSGIAQGLAEAGKLTVRREKKGRGGKTVTVIAATHWNDALRTDLAKHLRKALGTGASVEDERVVVQGALVERVADWLEASGARTVVRAN